MAVVDDRFPARIWLRVDSLQPLSCSVRFAMRRGEGRLTWGAAEPCTARPVMRTGTAAGLSASDLSGLSLSTRSSDHAGLAVFPLYLNTLPGAGRTRPGRWIELDIAQAQREGSTDLVMGFDGAVVDPDGPSTHVRPVLDVATESRVATSGQGALRTDGAWQLTSSLTESLPGLAGAPHRRRGRRRGEPARSSLIRSLVRRIRVQDEELKSLREELASLRGRVHTPRP